jgi:hypothetical protein
MTAEIITLPYSVTRRANSRKPRRSKNGTPEERAAKSAPPAAILDMDDDRLDGRRRGIGKKHSGDNPLRAMFLAMQDSVTIVGKVVYRRHGFDPSTLSPSVRREWQATLRDGAKQARSIADEFDGAIRALGGSPPKVATTLEFFKAMKAALIAEFNAGKSLDQIFDRLEREAAVR